MKEFVYLEELQEIMEYTLWPSFEGLYIYQAKKFELHPKASGELLSVWKPETDIISKLFWYDQSDSVEDGLGEEWKNWMAISIQVISITQVRDDENLN